jgi:glycerol-3-phosphate O-acyltransferase/dihydroxyacetone phosphate acyltransferase
MIYRLLRQIIKLSLFIYFKKIVVTGENNIPAAGPMIIVANHPNTLIDPLIITSITKQKIGFIANAGLFSNKLLARIFNFFNVIPIYRKKDILPGEKPDNRTAFSKCHEYLSKGNTILTFPEGSSLYELNLREIKTGTARIALSYEELQDFDGNLKILPIALDYSDSIQFRSTISITVSEPISIDSYRQAYANNDFETVLKLTEYIRKELAKSIPQTSSKTQEEFLVKSYKFYITFSEPMNDLQLDTKKSLALRNQVSKALVYTLEHHPDLYYDIQTAVLSFFKLLAEERLTPGFFTDHFLQKNKVLVCLNYLLKFIFLAPIYIFGVLINYLPYILPSQVFKALKIDIEYKASVEMITGLLLFPLFYSLEIWLFRQYISSDFSYTVLLFLAFLISGYVAMYYWTGIKRFKRVINFYFFMKSERKRKLLQLRDEILTNMGKAREIIV